MILNGLSKLEVRILTTAAFGLAFCGLLLSSEVAFERLLPSPEGRTVPSVKMARAENVVGQVYVKPVGQDTLMQVESGQDLYVGDSFRVGSNSRFSLRYVDGFRVFAQGDSFLRFDQFADGNLVSLDRGTFRVQLNGEFLAAIDGEPVRLSGQDAEIEIQVQDSGSFSSHVLSGEGYVAKLQIGRFDVPLITEGDPLHIYLWKFSDLFEIRDGEVRRRTQPLQEVNFDRDLLWDHSEPGPFSVQLAANEEFTEGRRFFTSPEKRIRLTKLRLGETFWRVSFDQKRWSAVGRFSMEAHYLESRCALRINRRAGQTFEFGLSTSSKPGYSFIIEISSDSSFPWQTTEVRTSQTGVFVYGFTKSGNYFVRARVMNQNQEISEPSAALMVTSISP